MEKSVAVLYQALEPPIFDGVFKPSKPGGYSDSGADIASALREAGVDVLTPKADPDPTVDLDWVFPDTGDGIGRAIAAGATVLWANTVVFHGHPIQRVPHRIGVVGQDPDLVQRFDDKWFANEFARSHGMTVVPGLLVTTRASREDANAIHRDDLSDRCVPLVDLGLPVVVKPVRGRGSEGVHRVADLDELQVLLRTLLPDSGSGPFGDRLMVEQFLPGSELTVTVMPAGVYRSSADGMRTSRIEHSPWSLPPVVRENHVDGVAPYNGVVAVTRNSRAIRTEEFTRSVAEIVGQCEELAKLIGPTAPIRIDCRASSGGEFAIFDVNMKPNMTGPGRPGRDDQDSLTLMAAREIGWDYRELLLNVLGTAHSLTAPPRSSG